MDILKVFEQQAVMFYRLDCRELTKDWPKEKLKALAMKMSKITLEDGKFYVGNMKDYWTFTEVPDREFTATKIYAWMQELCFKLGFDVDNDMTKMVNCFNEEKRSEEHKGKLKPL